ncbi:hypothetical protein [Hydrocoleum sp. CS-953]|uniref:hypothetical protein n=1 Tax=Hydrocoleum sp. CS-953 TaxID=1671698 RepID=UPI00117ADF5B|nr:hypothetical protein [Hydrocoleum sp. CS-953]
MNNLKYLLFNSLGITKKYKSYPNLPTPIIDNYGLLNNSFVIQLYSFQQTAISYQHLFLVLELTSYQLASCGGTTLTARNLGV